MRRTEKENPLRLLQNLRVCSTVLGLYKGLWSQQSYLDDVYTYMLNNKAAIAVRDEDQATILLLPNPCISQAHISHQGTSCLYLFGGSDFRADSMQHITT